jgi:hypothetical protein
MTTIFSMEVSEEQIYSVLNAFYVHRKMNDPLPDTKKELVLFISFMNNDNMTTSELIFLRMLELNYITALPSGKDILLSYNLQNIDRDYIDMGNRIDNIDMTKEVKDLPDSCYVN